ncbi:hypothetical protein AMC78_CH02866 [Rhizobium phaseoli]|uniref:hypothetical protein n=1 Tax=Rhizobium phaseoli TaxID=396 RepID=UPI0007E9816C|nr:hypothetical protein [Rhizobium phaseoli]ANM04944.1 hypothetical protein AMC78_CH02866 [Rhizobium phaseoli]
MLQLNTDTIAIRSPRVRSDWMSALREVGDIAHTTESFKDVRAAIDEARAAFVANARKLRIETDEYEFNMSIANVLFDTGFHRNRNGNVHRLDELISLEHPRTGHEQNRACIRFSISARLEDGSSAISRETLEWLDDNGNLISDGKYLDRHPEALIETTRALDAYATDIEKIVRAKLSRLLALIREHAA